MAKQKETKKKSEDKKTFDKEAYLRFLCEGLAGKGCGTETRTISHWHKEKTWEEKRRDFLTRDGD